MKIDYVKIPRETAERLLDSVRFEIDQALAEGVQSHQEEDFKNLMFDAHFLERATLSVPDRYELLKNK